MAQRLSLGKADTEDEVARRLFLKDSILTVLMAEEDGYPVFYVDESATGLADGSSWTNAFTDLQQGIDAAAASEGWVWVAQGTYSGESWGFDRDSYIVIGSIHVKSGVMVFGGFQGGEEHLSQRDPEAYPAIIEGAFGPEGPRAVYMDHLTMIDGFQIRNSGFVDFGSRAADFIAGGGIRTGDWLAIVRNNRIYNNKSRGGGGIAVWNRIIDGELTSTVEGYVPIIDRNYIYHNTGFCGAAMQVRQSEALVCNNVLVFNVDDIKPKGIEVVIDTTYRDDPVLVNNIIWGNAPSGLYGDIYNHVDYNGTVYSYYNCIEKDGYGPGLVTSDPSFKDPDNDDYSLSPNSPCTDAGHPDGPLDVDSTRADIGAANPNVLLTVIDRLGDNGREEIYSSFGSQVTLAADSLITSAQGTSRYTFLNWIGEGSGSYSGTDRQITLLMNGSIQERAVWKKEHLLTVESDYGIAFGEKWYLEGETASFGVNSRVANQESGSRKVFLEWSGSGVTAYSGPDSTASVIMQSAVLERAVWESQYLLSVSSDPADKGTVIREPQKNWYSEGDTVRLTATVLDTSWAFQNWDGGVSSTDNPLLLIIGTPLQIGAQFTYRFNSLPVIHDLPSLLFEEDTEYHLTLSDYIQDENDSLGSLSFSFTAEPHMQVSLDTAGLILTLHPEENWYGSGKLHLLVTDPWNGVAEDSLTYQVTEVNDAPSAFSLLSPIDFSTVYAGLDSLLFTWEEATDVEGDQITYSLYLANDTLSAAFSTPAATGLVRSHVKIGIASHSGILFWKVEAEDGQSKTHCKSTFRFSISTDVKDPDRSPRKFSLYPVYPNPFNGSTRISYVLPRRETVLVQVYSIRGRLVETLVQGDDEAGLHVLQWPEKVRPVTGLYLLRVQIQGKMFQQKMLLVE